MFKNRWRWNVTRALQMKRVQRGQRVPPQLQRMRAEDLLSAVFPAQTACQENVVGDIQVPDQPIVRQTVHDCLYEAADLDGLLTVLRGIESGAIEVVGLDSREPSPFAHELLNAHPYAFLDDAPLEERRTRAVTMRRSLSTDALRDLGRLDPEAIAQVRAEAWPLVRNADELHDLLLSQGALPEDQDPRWNDYFVELCATGRATRVESAERSALAPNSRFLWVPTERWPLIQSAWPDARACPEVSVPEGVRRDWPVEEAMVYLVRGAIECLGPTTVSALSKIVGLPAPQVEASLIALENQGLVLRGSFSGTAGPEWCDRRLLARIHRYTLEGLRRQIAPIPPEQFLRFLVRHQHLALENRLRDQAGLLALIEQLEGFEAPAGHWERYLLPARLASYNGSWLDNLTFFGQAAWGRLRPSARNANGATRNGRPMKALTRSTPITLMLRDHVPWLLAPPPEAPGMTADPGLGSNAQAAYEALARHGALFATQIGSILQLVPAQVDDVLAELAAAGLVTSDGFPALRTLIGTRSGRSHHDARRISFRRGPTAAAAQGAGRWTLLRPAWLSPVAAPERVELWCRLLLRRYGIMFRDLLANESAAPSWQELVRMYRRLEARGEIRGGRFVADVSGEQYALSEVVPILRSAADLPDQPVSLPATDPLNLTGRIGTGQRVPALPGHTISLNVSSR
jgi:ATP-dependent Lhr-like helicase